MKLEKLWDEYADYSRSASEHARTLAYAGGGLVWLLREPSGAFPPRVHAGLLCLIGFFIADTLQYAVAAVRYYRFTRSHEKRLDAKTKTIDGLDVDVPPSLDRPARFLWAVKLALVLLAWIWLGLQVLCSSAA